MTTVRSLSSPVMRLAVFAYRALNYLLIGPLNIFYLWHRGRRDPLYKQHISERLGFYKAEKLTVRNPVWIHAVSLGELRSAVPLIKALLDNNEYIVTTHFTTAGRREANKVFSAEIDAGKLSVVYMPLEIGFAFRRFYRKFKPKYGLVMEVEFWPGMILSARRGGIPLFLCNGQYPTRSFERDTKGLALRASVVQGFAGVMVKSKLQAERFRSLGVSNIAITGELRFEQPIPDSQIKLARQARTSFDHRNSIAIASAVEGEDDTYIQTILSIKNQCDTLGIETPLFIYVPRAPERFNEIAELLSQAGLNIARRSAIFNEHLELQNSPTPLDVLLGDSMGEMYFYLEMADQVIVGGGFTPNGAHNISEALALSRPVIVGPSIWTIEYPALEAIEAGVVKKVENQQALLQTLQSTINNPELRTTAVQVDEFFNDHIGAVDKTLRAIPGLLANAHPETERSKDHSGA